MTIDNHDIHALHRSQGSLPTEQKPLSLYCSPSFVNGFLQVIHQPEPGLEAGVEHRVGIFGQRADYPQIFDPDVCCDNHVEGAG